MSNHVEPRRSTLSLLPPGLIGSLFDFHHFRLAVTSFIRQAVLANRLAMAATTFMCPTPGLIRTQSASRGSSYAARAKQTGVAASTLWRRDRGRASQQDKAVKQQYLTPCEEKALVAYVLRSAQNGYPLPVKALRALAMVIKRQRSSVFCGTLAHEDVRPPHVNWPQAFYKRHPELRARRVKPLDWARHDRHIHDKVVEWFDVVGQELRREDVHPENVYNMDETGVLLGVLHTLKVLVGKDDLGKTRGAGAKRTLITAIECISADGRSLPPLIIWPAASHRSNWTTHPTPGWHFACTKTGYTNAEISLYWLQHVFEPQTAPRALHKPRILITDGFATHFSPEAIGFCLERNIVPVRIPSHTSHKLQPCDVGPFGPLKTAYREEVERLYRGGANTVDKRQFTLLYDRARTRTFTRRNICYGWSHTGLYPWNPQIVLQDIKVGPDSTSTTVAQLAKTDPDTLCYNEMIRTPVTSDAVQLLRQLVERDTDHLDPAAKMRLTKFANGAANIVADRDMLRDEAARLFEQNNEKSSRNAAQTVVGRAKVMSYEDVVAAVAQREAREASRRRKGKKKMSGLETTDVVSEEDEELTELALEGYCHVLRL